MDICSGKFYFSFNVTSVAGDVHPAFEHASEIRTVWIMARIAPALDKGFMRIACLKSLFGAAMAGVAELWFFLDKQLLILSGMSHMAGKTFPFGYGWFVFHCQRPFFVDMTGKAEFSALLCEEDRIL